MTTTLRTTDRLRNALSAEIRHPHGVDVGPPSGGRLDGRGRLRSLRMPSITAARTDVETWRWRPSWEVALIVAAVLGSVLMIQHGGIGPPVAGARDLDLLAGTLAVASALPLLAWRRHAAAAFAAATAVTALSTGLGYRLDLPLAATVGLYLLAAGRHPDAPWTRRHTLTAVGLLAGFLATAAAAQGALPFSETVHASLAWAVAWFAGERTRLRREHLAELRDRATRIEREAERDRQLAGAEERARIARDLHDSAAHAISIIALRAGAARMRHANDPDPSRAALEDIEQLARQTADEIDRMVATLRDSR